MSTHTAPRVAYHQLAPKPFKALYDLSMTVHASSLGPRLLDLVFLRVSQINGCAFCIDMHVKDAVKAGESHQRLHLLDGWRDSPAYTDRERAALNWTEALTRIAKTHAPDADYAMLQAQFNETEIAWLTLAIGAINLWNRVQIGLRAIPKVDAPTRDAA